MFKKLLLLSFIILFGFATSICLAKYSGGDGTPATPYRISDANDMNEIGLHDEDWGSHFVMVNDVNLADYTGEEFNLIGNYITPFTGVFDGNGFTISNFTYQANKANVGLFGHVGDPNAQVKDLTLIDANVDGGTGARVGAVVGYLSYGTISNCGVEGGNVSGRTGIGGLVGENRYGTISNCHATALVRGTSYSTGGLVGDNSYGVISDCYTTGSVEGEDYTGGLVGENDGPIANCYAMGNVLGDEDTGGLVGVHSNSNSTISDSYATGSISGRTAVGGLVGNSHGLLLRCHATGHVDGDDYTGGLVGYHSSYGTISNCCATGTVNGSDYTGGLVGCAYGGDVYNCYATGGIEGKDYTGGLVGCNRSSTISNCYATGTVNTTGIYTGGLVGGGIGIVCGSYWDVQTSGQSTSSGGRGKTTIQMKTESTFIGWGACGVSVWTIDEGNDYPHLSWENALGKPIPVHELSDFLIGTGLESDPYLVATADELNMIGLFNCEYSKNFKLIADINLAVFSGTQFNFIPTFTGVFDGNGFAISNFSYESNGDYVGLFGYVDGPNATIRNLILVDPNVDGGIRGCVGSLVGCLNDGTVIGCHVNNGSVSGACRYTGGLIGINDGTISNCSATGTVSGNYYSGSGNYYTGGLVGRNNGTISHSCVIASVKGDENGWTYEYVTGGLAGVNAQEGTISNCYVMGSVSGLDRYTGGLVGSARGTIFNCGVTGDIEGSDYTGGLVGKNNGTKVSDCYVTGTVSGHSWVGGLVGSQWYGAISNCYATGSVEGEDYTGGLLGSNYRCAISNCYAIGPVDGNTPNVGALVGANNAGFYTRCFWDSDINPDVKGIGNLTDPNVIGETTENMQTESTFTSAGWDFVGETANGSDDIWKMCYDPDYPHLFWEQCPKPSLEMPMHFTPRMLNPKSKGKWIKAHFILPEGFTVDDVNINSPAKIVEPFTAESVYMDVFINEDDVVEIEAAFDRAVFCSNGSMLEDIVVIARLTTGQYFYGTDTIRIKTNNLEYLAVLTSYWLEAGCGEPDWCEGSDINQDGTVDFIDFAFFDGCCLEFIQN